MTRESDLTEAVDATLKRLKADAQVDAQVLRRKRAVWRLSHEHGMTAKAIVAALSERLEARGYTQEQIKGMGVGLGSVRLASEPGTAQPPPPE